jgi:hypothetical protein
MSSIDCGIRDLGGGPRTSASTEALGPINARMIGLLVREHAASGP